MASSGRRSLLRRASSSGVSIENFDADGGGSINVQGEEQKTLDIMTNDVLKKALRFTGKMGVLASEEEEPARCPASVRPCVRASAPRPPPTRGEWRR